MKSIRIYTMSPLATLNDGLIHRASSRKLSSKQKENEIEIQKTPPETARLSNNLGNKPHIKVPQRKIRQGY